MTAVRFTSVLLMAAVLELAPPVAAQMIPCKETSALDKVYLDDVRAMVPSDASLDTLVQRIGYKLRANLRNLENRSVPEMKGLTCKARYPSGDNEFTPTLCQNLTSDKVLLEVWSSVNREADEEGEPYNVVDLSVVLVPMIANAIPGAPPGVLRFQQQCKPGESVKQSLKRLDAASLLWGLSRVACGLRAYALKSDGDAFGPLCEGARTLRSLKDPVQLSQCAALAKHADEIAAAARARLLQKGNVPDFILNAASCADVP